MKLNGDKCHLLSFCEKALILSIKIGNTTIIESTEGKITSNFTRTNNYLLRHTLNPYARKQVTHLLDTENSSKSCGLLSYPSSVTAQNVDVL